MAKHKFKAGPRHSLVNKNPLSLHHNKKNMCLFSKNIIPLVADKPIVCYKVFEEVYANQDLSEADTLILTPYMGHCVTKDEFNGKEPIKPDDNGRVTGYRTFAGYVQSQSLVPFVMVDSGVIHAYLSEKAAACSMKNYFRKMSSVQSISHFGIWYNLYRYVLCECEIPAGAKYYKGGEETTEINAEECCAAEQLVVRRIILEVKNGELKTM